MLPNLLDDLLKAWDAKATVEPGEEASAAPSAADIAAVPTAAATAAPVEDTIASLNEVAAPVEPLAAPPPSAELPTPMDDLLSSLLASFEPVVEATREPVVEAAVPEPAIDPVIEPVAEPAPVPVAVAVPEPPVEIVDDTPLPPPPPVREREMLEPLAAPQPAPATTRKFVAVSFGRQKIAFSIDAVVEAGRYPQTTFVPGLPPYIRGVFAFRGSVLPVVDTRLLTGAPERFLPQDCRVLTIQSGNAKAAFIFDTLEGIVNLDPAAALPVPDDDRVIPMRHLLSGINGEGAGERFGIADPARLLDLAGCLKEQA